MKKRFLIFGAGAIGTYIGASLGNQGHKVIVLEREKDIPALHKQGLKLSIGGREIACKPEAIISDISRIPQLKIDLAVLALKTYQLESILEDLIELKESLPPLLCLQNGVDSERLLADALGWERVIPGTVTSAVDRLSKGWAVVQKQRGMGIAGSHPLARNLVQTFDEAGLNCRYYTQPDSMKWSKLITNLLGNASSAILDISTAEIYSHSGLYRVELDQIREGLRVMRRQDIPPVNLPGVPVKVLAVVVRFLPWFLSKPLLSQLIGSGRGGKMPSFHIDLHSGKGQSEVNQLNGAVVRGGEQTGCQTPINFFLTHTLTALLKGELQLNHYKDNPGLFLADLQARKSERSLNG